jgi:endonuclease
MIPTSDGGVEPHPLKEWLRQNPDQVPSGLDATKSTSHQLRGGLRRLGWTMQETPTEIRLIKPGIALPEGDEPDFEKPPDEKDDAVFFTLEYQLRDFIAANLGTIPVDGRHLQLFVDQGGRDGIEYPSAVGPIDILAVDGDGAFFVFELKRARSPDYAMGQLTRYMGWIKQTIGQGHDVFGIIVARFVTDKLRYACLAVPNVRLFEYEVEFRLKAAHDFKS